MTIGRCKLCGSYLESDTFGGECVYCERLLRDLLMSGTFFLPDELRRYTNYPMRLKSKEAKQLALIRAEALSGKLTSNETRSKMEITLAVAKESGTSVEKTYIEKELIPCYKKAWDSNNEQLRKATEENERLAKILASRTNE